MGADDDAAKAVAELSAQSAALDKAAADAGAAAGHAGKTVGQAQQAGMRRVAEGMAGVRSQIERLAEQLANTTSQLQPGLAAASEAADGASAKETVAKLTVTTNTTDKAHATIAAAVTETGKIDAHVARLLDGAQPGPLLGMMQTVRQSATQALQHGQAGKKHAETGIAHATQAGGGGTGN